MHPPLYTCIQDCTNQPSGHKVVAVAGAHSNAPYTAALQPTAHSSIAAAYDPQPKTWHPKAAQGQPGGRHTPHSTSLPCERSVQSPSTLTQPPTPGNNKHFFQLATKSPPTHKVQLLPPGFAASQTGTCIVLTTQAIHCPLQLRARLFANQLASSSADTKAVALLTLGQQHHCRRPLTHHLIQSHLHNSLVTHANPLTSFKFC